MARKIYNVLFLCTGNSARSILAESILRKEGAGRFGAYSAGSIPKDNVHPMALKVLSDAGYPRDGFASKSWDVFAGDEAPQMDFIFTVCDNAAGEVCPVWPGQPMSAHWGIADPAAQAGTSLEQEAAFVTALRYMKNRITAFTNLPIASLDRLTLRAKLGEIGASEGATQTRKDVA